MLQRLCTSALPIWGKGPAKSLGVGTAASIPSVSY